ncbi:MAG: hypothetical protein WCZ27_09335 [Tissierellaceae bacterium]
MKRYISLFLIFTMIFTLTSCGSKTEKNTTLSLGQVERERAVVEQAAAIATQQYIMARLKTELLIEYDISQGSIDELRAMTDEALEAWRLSELASLQTAELADHAQDLADTGSGQIKTVSHILPRSRTFGLFNMVVHAAEENTAMKWAKELSEKFDSYPSGKKIKQLSEDLGTDAKRAFAQLKMAQDILEGAAYNDEADTIQQYENAAAATKTACKTGLYIGGVIAGGGVANGILEAGGLVIGGVDTLVDIAATGSSIILGKDNKVTIAAKDFKDTVEPIASIAGGINIFSGDSIKAGLKIGAGLSKQMDSLGKFNYIGESALNLVNEGKILGGMIKLSSDGRTNFTTTEISTEGKDLDQVAKELKEAGLPILEDKGPNTVADLIEEIEEKFYYTEEELEDAIGKLRDLLDEMLLDSEEEVAEGPTSREEGEEASTPTDVTITLPSIDEIVGTYSIVITSAHNGESYEGEVSFSKDERGQLINEYGDVYQYDQATGTAIFLIDEESSATEKYIFRSENGKVYYSGSFTAIGEEGTSTIYTEGSKID